MLGVNLWTDLSLWGIHLKIVTRRRGKRKRSDRGTQECLWTMVPSSVTQGKEPHSCLSLVVSDPRTSGTYDKETTRLFKNLCEALFSGRKGP